jgi:nicotinamidase-related amidase
MRVRSALIVIDVQKAIDAAYHAAAGPRNNPQAEGNIAKLLKAWRARNWPIVHIRHDSQSADSAYRPGQVGNEFKPEVAPEANEILVPKITNSAFIGTDLEALLRDIRIQTLIVTGVTTNNSVEATVRMAGNLGFGVILAEDACFTFAQHDYEGVLRSAAEVHAMSLANLDGEYCTVSNCASILEMIAD